MKRARLLLLPMLLAAAIATPAHGLISFFVISFDSGSARLDDIDRAILDNVVAAIDATNPGYIVMAGHSDRAGAPGPNRRLSCRRARAVRDYLAARGVAMERMGIEGYGEERPLNAADDEFSEPNNRRVELVFLEAGMRPFHQSNGNC